ncbi:MAG: PAQR family membrane homeostasis protein TrhA [Spirochaetota bacterium]
MTELEKLPREIVPSEVRYESGNAIEEIFNSITHAMGAGLSIAGLVVLLVITGNEPSPWKYAAFSIYGATQILLYLSSAIMHSFAALPRIRVVLRVIDQVFVFILIAGTYTPVTLIAMRESRGWLVFGLIWGLAIVGIVVKTVFNRKQSMLTDLIYLPMGWLIVIAFRPLTEATSPGFITWMLIGGACYTVGVIFYAWKRLPFNHVAWHLFVIGGSVSFFMAYALHLA